MKAKKCLVALAALPFLFGFTNIAYRGDNQNGKYAEHSYQAYDRALTEQANYLELDIHKTSDNVLVVSHDNNLSRLFGVDLDINKTPYAKLAQYRNQAGEPVHTLAEVFNRYKNDPNIKFMIETKNVGSATGMENELVNLVRQYGMQNRVLFESFSIPSLNALAQLAPEIPRTQLSGSYQNIGDSQYYANGYFDSNVSAYLKSQGKKYLLWGVDNADKMRQLVNSGQIDGIITNYPGTLSKVLGVTQYPAKNIDGTIIVKYKNNYSVNLWNGYGKNAHFSGLRVKNGTSHHVTQVAIENGKTWYKLDNNKWIDGQYVVSYAANKNSNSVPVQSHGVIQIKYKPGFGVNLWGSPQGTHYLGRRLKHGSRWKYMATANYNGRTFYNLGGSQWIDGKYVIKIN
ncbi:glycerophosphodiester phosphodiesterase [Lactobacillus hominis]|uniref:Glycerophosphodiesterase n=1 Tax=Lactobacillus hominis DSM 23910 = CRBIP 24.179 TaxID=1423758 RepID=I7L9H3_9LACO|nr:glycerophosphodiester phosphodiesterase family protein [Lactobacillus hominis]KRM84265.1 glycerophosphodiester phosphodiesterase family protein [Lactobacillus hominis DSM 23910 = CRBIP 24.179]MCT3348266.1 glycerophosphodiester phosphodiesterase [Lactobacillus hominis]CCI81369.1 Glycerophosphodiesterase [Lactobacillus hominis DSM 23910 = CRBIP 24.179]